MQQGNILNFKQLSQFKDIKDFNNNIEQWMLDLKDKFTKAELVALKRLIRFSAKVAGVCNAKIGTIVSATHENDGIGISRSSFKRMILKAKEYNLLTVHEAVRTNGSKSSNVYVFNRLCVDAEPSKKEKLNQHKTINLSKTSNQNNNIRTENEIKSLEIKKSSLDASFVGEHVPEKFVNFVSRFFNDAKKIEEFWKVVFISARENKVGENLIETGINAFKVLVHKIKFSNVSNAYGFYYGILNKKFKAMYLKNMFNNWWYERVVNTAY
ncbi:hypothetical protein [Niallia taxi]|uniref:hypothetical protein n=1 Tax=Niallia taxi TaxID=2499688 RepID=UPI002E24BADD|nr:hypothetical protein [Niallia taxi]